MITRYTVTLEIEMDAETPEAAARDAQREVRATTRGPLAWDVLDRETGRTVTVVINPE